MTSYLRFAVLGILAAGFLGFGVIDVFAPASGEPQNMLIKRVEDQGKKPKAPAANQKTKIVATSKAKQKGNNRPTPIELLKAATSRSGFPAEGYPILPSVSTEMRGKVCNEIAKSAPVRAAYEKLKVAGLRNNDWFAGVAMLEQLRAVWCLQSCLVHPSEDVQIRALQSLTKLKDKQAVPFLLLYADYMAVHESGSENATIHGVIHRWVAKALSATTGIEVVIDGQDPQRLKRGIQRWRRWLVLQED